MVVSTSLFISCMPVSGYRQIVGSEARDALIAMGMTHVLVDDNGLFHALSKDNELLEGYRLYERQSVVTMEVPVNE